MATDKEKSPVGIPNNAYLDMATRWSLIHALLGGTLKMRDAGREWLPQEPAESITAYDNRLNRSILYNGLRDTINKLKNRPFTNPVIYTDIPSEIEYLKEDVDGNNTSLNTFLLQLLETLITYGVAHIYVDHSDMGEETEQLTKADEQRLGARVFLTNISPVSIIGWQTERSSKSIELTQLRVKDVVTVPDGDYGDANKVQIKVFSKDSWEIHEQDGEDEDIYHKVDDGKSSLGRIPLISIYANRTGFMTAEPPLMDLAWLNLAHWQSYSDQRNILRFSRFGLIFGKGLPENMLKAGAIEIGPTRSILVDSENADMKYVEHNGQAIAAGQKDIEDIEVKMRILGNQPLMREIPGTATAERIDEGRTISLLQAWVRAIERGIKQALKIAAEWRKINIPETLDVNIYSDFDAVVLGGGDKELLLKMRQAGEITRERHLREQQRRGVLATDVDIEAEAEAAEKEDSEGISRLVSDMDNEDNEDNEGE